MQDPLPLNELDLSLLQCLVALTQQLYAVLEAFTAGWSQNSSITQADGAARTLLNSSMDRTGTSDLSN